MTTPPFVPNHPDPNAPIAPDPPDVRSAVPKVLGILMLIFGAFAAFGGFFGVMSSGPTGDYGESFKMYTTVSFVFDILALVIGAFELWVGIKLIGYKDTAPKFAMIWGVLNIASVTIFAILMYVWLKPKLAGIRGMGDMMLGVMVLFRAFISISWSVVVMALITRPYPKASCTNY